jgi:hypothetical protein
VKSYVEIDRWTLTEELWLWGEDELHLRPLQMSDAELVSLHRLAATIYFGQRKARSAGEACASAAVALLGGRERPLARKRRRPRSTPLKHAVSREARLAAIVRIANAHIHS